MMGAVLGWSVAYVGLLVVVLGVGVVRAVGGRWGWGRGRGRGAPGPRRWPIVGNLHLLRGYEVPYQAFVELSREFGEVFSLQLGAVPAVVVQGVENIREVLVQKSHHFDSRPNFRRYHELFHGDKENSLAFCDWSSVQKRRRELLKEHVFPKVYSEGYRALDRVICEEVGRMIEEMRDEGNNNSGAKGRAGRRGGGVKQRVLRACASIFLRYFCSAEVEQDEEFGAFVEAFDAIFYEVNQGYAYDFLPFLGVFYRREMRRVQRQSEAIRRFVLKRVVGGRLEGVEEGGAERDYVDALLRNVKFGGEGRLSLETALFSLEDIIGGHSAIGNFLVKLLAFLVDNEEVQRRVREEVDGRGKGFVTLEDRVHMPYTEAVVMEALRMLSSPIVPHVSNQDTTIAGFPVKKDTLVFLNNYDLNMSDSLWSNPRAFDPSRFLSPDTGAKAKPAHFLPFGGGRRSCMGYKLVQFVSFVFVANTVSNFDICSVPGENYQQLSIGNLALPTRTFQFDFRIRLK